jgi:hypothetical protein
MARPEAPVPRSPDRSSEISNWIPSTRGEFGPGARVSIEGHRAAIAMDVAGESLDLKVRVQDGVTDLRAEGRLAQGLAKASAELAERLAHEGLSLGKFDTSSGQPPEFAGDFSDGGDNLAESEARQNDDDRRGTRHAQDHAQDDHRDDGENQNTSTSRIGRKGRLKSNRNGLHIKA